MMAVKRQMVIGGGEATDGGGDDAVALATMGEAAVAVLLRWSVSPAMGQVAGAVLVSSSSRCWWPANRRWVGEVVAWFLMVNGGGEARDGDRWR
ncbi:hypothetical protein Dimus_018281 [Dionaea muscipula]